MSVADLLQNNNYNLKSESLTTSGDINVGGNLSVTGSQTFTGNLSVQNSSPVIQILNNSNPVNTNRATLSLNGGTTVPLSAFNVQQIQDGSAIIENFNNNSPIGLITHGTNADINIIPGGRVSLQGSNYPVGPYLLGLDSSRKIINGGSIAISGTFIPVLQFGGASVGITYSKQQGQYTRNGNIVHFNINITLTNKGSSVGTVGITGLPFDITSSLSNQTAYVNFGNITYTAGAPIFASIVSGGPVIFIGQSISGGSQTFFADTNFANNSGFGVSGFYFIA